MFCPAAGEHAAGLSLRGEWYGVLAAYYFLTSAAADRPGVVQAPSCEWSPSFLDVRTDRVDLPDFPGARAIDEALAAGVETTGVTVHLVDEGLDTGTVIRQEPVPVEPVETLPTRIQAVEHRLLPEVVRTLCAQ